MQFAATWCGRRSIVTPSRTPGVARSEGACARSSTSTSRRECDCAFRTVCGWSRVRPRRWASSFASEPMSKNTELPPELRDQESPPEADGLAISYGRDILVVDDNQANLIAVEAALSPLGRKLVFAHSGVEALGKLLEQDFALIILDVAMPGMDGFETAKLVRARDKNRSTPIIFVTGMSWQDDAVIRGYELGAFDFLMKPVRPEVLRAKASVFVQLQERTIELKAKADELREAQTRAHEREMLAQRRRFEAEVMERQMAQLAETDRRKDEFLAILAHELRNPLQPLQTAVEVLEHDPAAPVPARVRGIIQRQVHHL